MNYQNPYIFTKDGNIEKVDTNVGGFIGNSTILGRYKYQQTGVKVGLSNNQHEVSWQFAKRQLPWKDEYPKGYIYNNINFSRLQVFEGDTHKSSIKYRYNFDLRDSMVFPTIGRSLTIDTVNILMTYIPGICWPGRRYSIC